MASSSGISLAILDDYADTAPQHFRKLPGLDRIDSYADTLNPSKPEDLKSLVSRLQPYQAISCMRERTAFPAQLLAQLPNLKLLLTSGLRNAAIDLDAARERGIAVTGTKGDPPSDPAAFLAAHGDLPPEADFQSTNQQAWALLLALAARIPADDRALRTEPRAWQSGVAVPLGGKTLGLLGLGRLGALMARTAVLGFGMRVVAWSENLTQERADAAVQRLGLAPGSCRVVGKEELFRAADVVSVHYVLSERSRGIVGERELGWMKPTALLVNTSRGPLIDEQALLAALKQGNIRGAALDVFWEEPLSPDSPWRDADSFKSQVVLSPHMGYVNNGTMHRWYEEQAEVLDRWLRGDELLHKMN